MFALIKITADSTCDLSPEIVKDLDITLIPLTIHLDENEFKDGVDVTPQDIFRHVDIEGKVCKTAAVNVYEYESRFAEFAKEYEAVIHINLSSGLSSSYQNALLAAQKFDNVYILDSQNLSTGSGLLVFEAVNLAKEGLDAKEIFRRLTDAVPKIDASFVIENLEYLHKGGRCSGIEAIGASFFRIKPSIEVVDGKMRVGKKYRGKFEVCLEKYIEDKLANTQDIDESILFITHSSCSEEIVSLVKDTVQRYVNFTQIIETEAGCTISSHCGPNTLGILFKRKNNKTF